MSVAHEIASNPKTPLLVSSATTWTGFSTWLEWIPDDIGKLASLVGICLSILLMRVHLLTVEKAKLEIKIMREKEAERIEAANRRENTSEV